MITTTWRDLHFRQVNTRRYVRKLPDGRYRWRLGVVGAYYADAEIGLCDREDLPEDVALRCDANYLENQNLETLW